jgi:hypothetical protein
MARIHTTYTGPHTLDLTDLEGALVDLKSGSRQGMRTELEGFAETRAELQGSTQAHRDAAGISPDLFEHFTTCTDRLARLDEKVAIAEKQLEVLLESRAYYVDAQQNDVSLMVDSMRSRARRRQDRGILIPFEQTLRYSGQIGHKGALTKRRKAAEAAAAPRAAAAKGKGKGKGARPGVPSRAGGAKSAAAGPAPDPAPAPPEGPAGEAQAAGAPADPRVT